jgi:hypothetical protein
VIEHHCVKCGKTITEIDTSNRLCAPCCADCREAVIKEVKRNYSTWPHDWDGHWSWHKGHWYVARKMDGTGL